MEDAGDSDEDAPFEPREDGRVLAAPATLGNGIKYQSALQKVAVDCNARTWAVTRFEFFAGEKPSGTPVYTYAPPREEWALRPAREGTNGAMLLHVLCTTPRPW